LTKVLRWTWPRRTNSARSRPGSCGNALLIGPLHARLEADQVELTLRQILLPQLHHRPRAACRPAHAGRPASSAHSAGVDAAPRHLLDRQAAFEEHGAFEVVKRQYLGLDDRAMKRLVLLAVERRVEVVVALAPARGAEELPEVEASPSTIGAIES
jgi:hypothetical protein